MQAKAPLSQELNCRRRRRSVAASLYFRGNFMKRHAFFSLLLLTGFAHTAFADSAGPELSPTRAYPPSCVALPLPVPAGNEPVWSTRVTVPTVDSSYNFAAPESVTYLFWRTPCNGGSTALIGQMQRDNALAGHTPFPIFAQL